MEILLILIVGTLNITCFFVGARVGQSVVKGERVEIPSLNPVKAYREAQEKKDTQKQQDRIDTIMQNLEAYNGTSLGQKEVN